MTRIARAWPWRNGSSAASWAWGWTCSVVRCVADRCNFLHVILRIKGEKQKPEKLLSCSQHQKPCVQAIALCFVLCLSSSENSGSCLRCTSPWPELTASSSPRVCDSFILFRRLILLWWRVAARAGAGPRRRQHLSRDRGFLPKRPDLYAAYESL